MTAADLQELFGFCLELAFMGGVFGGLAFYALLSLAREVSGCLDRACDKQNRIADARWRGHWNAALREARQAGHKGRRAIAYAADAMKTRRQANADLRAHG